jgi:hypothetical protein
MRLSHEKPRGGYVSEILVGTVAAEINYFLKFRGEDTVLKARKIGQVLKSLGLRTERLGNLGRGMQLNSRLRREIHELARRFEIDRLALCSPDAPKLGYGGAPCALCEEFGLEAGLRYVPATRWRPRTLTRTRSLLAQRDWGTEVDQDDNPPDESSQSWGGYNASVNVVNIVNVR